MVRELGKTNSVFNQFLSEIRNIHMQQDRLRFRRNLERMGEIFAYEIKELPYKKKDVITPLGTAHMEVIEQQPLLASNEGIQFLKKIFSRYKIKIWIGAIDNELTAKAYIVSGLGDAGDLAYGKKED